MILILVLTFVQFRYNPHFLLNMCSYCGLPSTHPNFTLPLSPASAENQCADDGSKHLCAQTHENLLYSFVTSLH